MSANTLYKIFEICRENDDNDLIISIARYRVDHPELTHEEEKELRQFLGRHAQKLSAAFPDSSAFLIAFDEAVKEDKEREEAAAKAAAEAQK